MSDIELPDDDATLNQLASAYTAWNGTIPMTNYPAFARAVVRRYVADREKRAQAAQPDQGITLEWLQSEATPEMRAVLNSGPASKPVQAEAPNHRPSPEWYRDKIAETLDDDFIIGPATQQAEAPTASNEREAPPQVFLVLQNLHPRFHASNHFVTIKKVVAVCQTEERAQTVRTSTEESYHEEFPGYRSYKEEPVYQWTVEEMPILAALATQQEAQSETFEQAELDAATERARVICANLNIEDDPRILPSAGAQQEAQPQAEPLTVAQIDEVRLSLRGMEYTIFDFARAVIAKFCEVNGIAARAAQQATDKKGGV